MEIKKSISSRVNGEGKASSMPWQSVPTWVSEGNWSKKPADEIKRERGFSTQRVGRN